jgi:hypothetical protein
MVNLVRKSEVGKRKKRGPSVLGSCISMINGLKSEHIAMEISGSEAHDLLQVMALQNNRIKLLVLNY